MKHIQNNLPGALLLAFSTYCLFTPPTISHSAIIFSLAALFGYQQFLIRQEQPSVIKELAQLKLELNNQAKEQKEAVNAKFTKLEDETTKLALAVAARSVSSSSNQKRDLTKVHF